MLINAGAVIVKSNIAETLNESYINIVQKRYVQRSRNFVLKTNSLDEDSVINKIVEHLVVTLV